MEIVGKTPAQESQPDSSFVNEVKLQKYANNVYGLNRNGHAMRCPVIPPTIIQRVTQPESNLALLNGQQQQPTVEQFEQPKPCNSNCPLFQMGKGKSSEQIVVDICCGKTLVHYNINDIIPYISQSKK